MGAEEGQLRQLGRCVLVGMVGGSGVGCWLAHIGVVFAIWPVNDWPAERSQHVLGVVDNPLVPGVKRLGERGFKVKTRALVARTVADRVVGVVQLNSGVVGEDPCRPGLKVTYKG